MYAKIILPIFFIAVALAYFYLNALNQSTVQIILSETKYYTLPVALVLFIAFAFGIITSIVNFFFVDAKRFFKDVNLKRKEKSKQKAKDNYSSGVDYLMRDNYKKAISLLTKAIDGDKSNVSAVLKLAESYNESGNPEEALKISEEAAIRFPENLELLFSLADYQLEHGDLIKSKKTLKEILTIDDNNNASLLALREISVDEGNWREAASNQKKLLNNNSFTSVMDSKNLKIEKTFYAAYQYEGAMEFLHSGETERAVELVKKSLSKDSNFVPSLILQGEIHVSEGSNDKAIQLWKKSYSESFYTIFLIKLEELYMTMENPDEALSIYSKAIENDNKNVSLRLLSARLMLKLAMVDDAVNLLEDTDIGDTSAYYNVLLAEGYLRKDGSVDETNSQNGQNALQQLRLALNVDKDFTPPFECSHCKCESHGYVARCPSCGAWSTFIIKDKNLTVEEHQISPTPVYEEVEENKSTPLKVNIH